MDIREGIARILRGDLITSGMTHENPPPHKDCGEDCGVSLEDQIAAANPICSPVRSKGVKHKRCVDCWNDYITGLVKRIQEYEISQGVVQKVEGELPKNPYPDDAEQSLIPCDHRTHRVITFDAQEAMLKAGYVKVKELE